MYYIDSMMICFLQLLMCGMGTVNYNDLKIHAVVNGSSDGFRNVVSWFWNIVSGFTQEEMAKLVQFVTGENETYKFFRQLRCLFL